MQPLQKADLFKPASHIFGAPASDLQHIIELNPQDMRHDKQLNSTVPPDIRDLSVVERCFSRSTTTNKRGDTQPLCLFNLIIALEWVPSVEMIVALKTALMDASRLLFDVTDGYMAIGQVLIGDMELMGCADIQIFASNRLFPRSSVNAMNDKTKYRPIRLGRGLWNKNERTSISWSTRSGFATIVHELGHHALGLKDQYLGFTPNGLVVPQNSLVKDTIMASLESSELLAPRPNRQDSDPDSEWEALRRNPRFKWLAIDERHRHDPIPPSAPLPTTQFFATDAIGGDTEEVLLVLDPSNVASGEKRLDLSHSWVYLLRMGTSDLPEQFIPQGSFESRSDGFRLLGAKVGDRVLLCGSELGKPGTPLNLWATISEIAGITAALDGWQDATPKAWPLIDVVPQGIGPMDRYTLYLGAAAPAPWQTLIFPVGAGGPIRGTSATNLRELDGHVVLISTATGWEVAITSYSLGGSPASAFPAHPNPIPAGSPDGNAMLFFYDSGTGPSYAALYGNKPEAYLIVTSTNHHAPTLLPLPSDAVARSYIFTVASNLPMNDLASYQPTLVLYYDKETRDSSTDTLQIERYDASEGWVALSGCEEPPDQFFVAAPLNAANAPLLYDGPQQFERYRLFLKRA
jgi:hypothetical protein